MASELIAIVWILLISCLSLALTVITKKRHDKRRQIEFDRLIKKLEDVNKLDSSDGKSTTD